ncbi:MAG TPA: hypothetical protein PLC79_06105 [Phycisphaerae bacterium]|nr:hypothetical protein [Phycisphaerae bacterium]
MALLTDPERLRHYRQALRSWECTGYVVWSSQAAEWVRANLEGLTTKGVARLMWEYVEAGGEIDEVRETRPEWSEHEYHYDLRFEIDDRRVYIETRLLMEADPEDSTIHVVNAHDA